MTDTYASPADAVAANPPAPSAATDPVIWIQDGAAVPAGETTSVGEASDALTAYRGSQADSRALSISADFQREIDALRANGVTIGAEPDAPTPAESTSQWAAAQQAAAPVAQPEDEVSAALAIPEVRAALEETLSETERTRAAYSQGLANAQQVAQSSLLVVAPELQNVPIAQFAQALQVLQNVNPARYLQVVSLLEHAGQVAAAQQHDQAHEVAQREKWRLAQDARYRQMIGPIANAEAFGPALVEYSEELGIGRDQMIHLLQTNSTLMSAPMMKIIHDAVQARIVQRKAQAALRNPSRPVPPVQRPGVTQPRGAGDAERTKSFEHQLSKTGRLDDAFKLLLQKRAR
jgi:hypothetical protein